MSAGYPPAAPRVSRSARRGEDTRAPVGLGPAVNRPDIRGFAPPLRPELPPGMPTLPVIAASEYAARWNCSPYSVRPGAYPQCIAAGFSVANSRASRRIVSAGTPVMGWAHSGVLRIPSVKPSRYDRHDESGGVPGGRCASSKPSTRRSQKLASWRFSVTITYAIATSIAVSVEGRIRICSSASWKLVWVTRGSTHTTRVPFFLAHFRYSNVFVPKWPSPGLHPHMTINLEFA